MQPVAGEMCLQTRLPLFNLLSFRQLFGSRHLSYLKSIALNVTTLLILKQKSDKSTF